MLYQREKIILALLEQLGEAVSSIKLQKLLFLLCDRLDNRPYDFIPYKYGCYSFQISQDLRHLESSNLIKVFVTGKEKKCCLNFHAVGNPPLIDEYSLSLVKKVVCRYGSMQTSELIKYTYIQYPFFAINSEILRDYFNETEIKTIMGKRPHETERTLFTIGYEGLSLERYILKLILSDIKILYDVRRNAFSQKFGFSKSLLSKACEGVGIKYIHVPELGIISEKRRNLRTSSDYDILFAEYENTVLEAESNALNGIYKSLQSEGRVALTCFEHDPQQCHRLRIATKLISTPKCNYNLINL